MESYTEGGMAVGWRGAKTLYQHFRPKGSRIGTVLANSSHGGFCLDKGDKLRDHLLLSRKFFCKERENEPGAEITEMWTGIFEARSGRGHSSVVTSTSLWTMLEAVHHATRLLVLVLETRRAIQSPPFQLAPIPAHARLARSRPGRILKAGVAGSVVGVADDVLAKLVEAVELMDEGDALRPLVMRVHDRTIQGSLFSRWIRKKLRGVPNPPPTPTKGLFRMDVFVPSSVNCESLGGGIRLWTDPMESEELSEGPFQRPIRQEGRLPLCLRSGFPTPWW